MNIGYAVSDFFLALACLVIAVRTRHERPGVALACATVGAAACVGVLRFSGLEVVGAHQFLSLVGGTAALPLLATTFVLPDSKPAENAREASLMLLVCAALGIAFVAGGGYTLWGKALPAASALAIFGGNLYRDRPLGVLGAVVLLATFGAVSSNLTSIAGLAPIEVLHYGMAAAFLLLCL